MEPLILTKAMRDALAEAHPLRDLREHVRGQTLNALVGRGLVRFVKVGGEVEARLTNEGLDARDAVR